MKKWKRSNKVAGMHTTRKNADAQRRHAHDENTKG